MNVFKRFVNRTGEYGEIFNNAFRRRRLHWSLSCLVQIS